MRAAQPICKHICEEASLWLPSANFCLVPKKTSHQFTHLTQAGTVSYPYAWLLGPTATLPLSASRDGNCRRWTAVSRKEHTHLSGFLSCIIPLCLG